SYTIHTLTILVNFRCIKEAALVVTPMPSGKWFYFHFYRTENNEKAKLTSFMAIKLTVIKIINSIPKYNIFLSVNTSGFRFILMTKAIVNDITKENQLLFKNLTNITLPVIINFIHST